MRGSSIATTRNIVLVGGGHTHALFLRMWGMKRIKGINLTLINPHPTAPYTGMLPGYIAGHYKHNELKIDLFKLSRFSGARLVLGKATSILSSEKLIAVGPKRRIHYDFASIDVGITGDLPSLSGFSEHGIAAKPLDQYSLCWDALLERVKGTAKKTNLAVIGSGVAGVELALAMSHRFEIEKFPPPSISIVERSGHAMPTTNKRTREKLLKTLSDRGINVLLNKDSIAVTETQISFSDGSKLDSDFTVGAAGAQPYNWLEQTHLNLSNGFIDVDEFLKSTNDDNIYAVGDCANMVASPRPKAGVFAVRQAPILFHNICAELSGGNLKTFRPQKSYLKLVSTGEKSAIADRSGFSFSGPALWKLKDRIDRRFMNQFENFPSMKRLETMPPSPHKTPREVINLDEMCGACGAKVPAAALSSSLQILPALKHKNILSGPGDDASVLKIGDTFQVVTTDHLRAFAPDPWLLAKTALVHALGDIWAMGAKPHSVLSSITLAPSSEKLQIEALKEIMSAIKDVAQEEGLDVIGGHTSVGAELSIGFTAIGFRDTPPISQSGAKPGDALILTKPIGTGVLLAAEMLGKADGSWIRDVYAQLVEPSARASNILAKSANAMTDVTGFGLAGHLALMMRASKTSAQLFRNTIPHLTGAIELAAKGIRSTLWQSNCDFVHELDHDGTPDLDLLLDPQTSGGLLASVPSSGAESLLHHLKEVAPASKIIGKVTAGPTKITWDQ